MPRTVESILANHNAAVALRRAGKSIWQHRIPLHSLLASADPNADADGVVALAREIGQLIRRLPARLFEDFDLEEVTQLFETLTADEVREGCKRDHCSPLDVLDDLLDQLYDACDRNRIWTGA
jgi:hypothetical protein